MKREGTVVYERQKKLTTFEPDEPLGSFSLLRGQLTLGDDARYQLLLRAIVLRMDRCLHAICRKNDSEALIIYGKEFLQH